VSRPGYRPLYDFFVNLPLDELRVSFAYVEEIMEADLPRSARSPGEGLHWWQGDPNCEQALSGAWQQAGFQVRDVDVEQEMVTFYKPILIRPTAIDFINAEIRRAVESQPVEANEAAVLEVWIGAWILTFCDENDLPASHRFVRAFEEGLREALNRERT